MKEYLMSVRSKVLSTIILCVVSNTLLVASEGFSKTNGYDLGSFDDFITNYIEGRLQIGTRIDYRIFTNSDSGHKGGTQGTGTYLGTIYALEVQQDYLPRRFFLSYFFTQQFGLEFAYDSITGRTRAIDSETEALKTDGDATLSGPTISLLGRYPNSTYFTPYAGIGVGLFSGDFEETAAWAHSYWGTDDRNRRMSVDNVTAFLLTLGVTWEFDPHWLLDGSLQYMKADADAVFYGDINGIIDTVQAGHFPMDNVALRLGVIYSF